MILSIIYVSSFVQPYMQGSTKPTLTLCFRRLRHTSEGALPIIIDCYIIVHHPSLITSPHLTAPIGPPYSSHQPSQLTPPSPRKREKEDRSLPPKRSTRISPLPLLPRRRRSRATPRAAPRPRRSVRHPRGGAVGRRGEQLLRRSVDLRRRLAWRAVDGTGIGPGDHVGGEVVPFCFGAGFLEGEGGWC